MNYFRVGTTSDPSIIGGRGYDQVSNVNGSLEELNAKLRERSSSGLKDVSDSEIDLRFNSRLTDVIYGGMLSFLWIVSLRFLKTLKTFHNCPLLVEPAKIRYRNQFIEDYFLFQPALVTNSYKDSDLINFSKTVFTRATKFPQNPPEQKAVSDINEYLELYNECKERNIELRMSKFELATINKFDYFYISSPPILHVMTEPLKLAIENDRITGLIFQKLDFDSSFHIWG